jgi:hypothetical protein
MAQTSANTEVIICQTICTTGGTGSDVVSIKPPHPVYSDLTGGTVVQLNMVTLGGPTGLNN